MRTPGDDHFLIVRMNGKYLILITINCSQTKVLWSWFQMTNAHVEEILELKSQDVKKANLPRVPASLGHLVRLKNLIKF